MPPIPEEGNKRGEELGVDAPVPVTGEIDTEDTTEWRSFTCMWQYVHPTGPEADEPEWFVSDNQPRIRDPENQGWQNPEGVELSNSMTSQQVQQLNNQWRVDGEEQQNAEFERVFDVEDGGTIEDIVGRVLDFIF